MYLRKQHFRHITRGQDAACTKHWSLPTPGTKIPTSMSLRYDRFHSSYPSYGSNYYTGVSQECTRCLPVYNKQLAGKLTFFFSSIIIDVKIYTAHIYTLA